MTKGEKIAIMLMAVISTLFLILILWNPPGFSGKPWPPPGCHDINPGKGAELRCE